MCAIFLLQAKQKRNSRKVKDRTKDEKSDMLVQDKNQKQRPCDENLLEELSSKQGLGVRPGNTSDTSNTEDDVAEIVQPDLDDGDCSPLNWDADALEVHSSVQPCNFVMQNGQSEKRTTSVVDDSSSTCSSDSILSVVPNGSHRGNYRQNSRSQTPPNR